MSEELKPAVQVGDVWRLGEHRLVCGDATNPEHVVAALAGHRPHLMVTDPPYGVNYEPAWRARMWKGARALGTVLNDDNPDWSAAWALFPGDIAYVWHGALNGSVVEGSLIRSGFLIRSQIIWDKGRLIISRGHYHWRHEPCWYAVRKGKTASWAGDRRQMTVWQVPHRRSETGHGTQKPVEIMLRPILNHTRPGDRVYDPFIGSGTTLMAAEEIDARTGRIITGRAHLAQSLATIWTTRIGERVMLLDFGTNLRSRLAEDISGALALDIYDDLVTSVRKWEPEYRAIEFQLVSLTRIGGLGLRHDGLYYPEGRLGNFDIVENFGGVASLARYETAARRAAA